VTEDQKSVYINVQVALFNCRVAGMVAENMQRHHAGMSMAYHEDSFTALEREFEARMSKVGVEGV